MKKIIILILTLCLLEIPTIVKGFNFYLYCVSMNYYVRLEGEENFDFQLCLFNDKDTSNKSEPVLYRISPFTDVSFSVGEYTFYEGYLSNYDKLTEEQKETIEELAYFGYNYSSRTGLGYYAYTQMLIWQTIYGEDNIYFIDQIGGEKTNIHDVYMNEIKTSVAQFKEDKMPKEHININVNNSDNVIYDALNLSEYEIISSDFTYKIEDNKLKIDNIEKDGKIYLGKKESYSYYKESGGIYSFNGNDILKKGSIYYDIKEINIKLNKGVINLYLDVIRDAYSVEADLHNTCYELLKDDIEFSKVCFNNDLTEYVFDNLEIGSYSLLPLSMGTGYTSDYIKTFEFTFDKLVYNIEIPIKLIANKIEIYKSYIDNDKITYDESLYAVYDINDNLVDTIKTNELGYGVLEVGYGKYKIVQLEGKEGYTLDNELIEIDSLDSSYKLEFVGYNDIEGNAEDIEDIVIPDTGINENNEFINLVITSLLGTLLFIFKLCK